jgi:hypothetical protein
VSGGEHQAGRTAVRDAQPPSTEVPCEEKWNNAQSRGKGRKRSSQQYRPKIDRHEKTLEITCSCRVVASIRNTVSQPCNAHADQVSATK